MTNLTAAPQVIVLRDERCYVRFGILRFWISSCPWAVLSSYGNVCERTVLRRLVVWQIRRQKP